VVGVVTGRFTRLLEDRGCVFGIKFRPAGFHPVLRSPVSALTNRMVAVSEVLGPAGVELVERIRALGDTARRAEVAEAFIRDRRPEPDPTVPLINQVVTRIMAEREITRVADVVSRTGIGERRLQRLFAEYVGVNPKWVIRRYRLHEAAERLAAGEVDLAELALELGYFDQAHFARDFRTIVGKPPAGYARSAGS
jgi:AraC-like DNA-binding protein